jgi:hypothetical protein
MEIVRYPVKSLIGLGIAAALSLYAGLDFYGAQSDLNKVQRDPYQIANQEKRFEALKRELPTGELVGYVSDLAPDPAIILSAQYVLAPLLFVNLPPHGWVIGNFSRPTDYAAFGRARGLTVVKEFPSGVILYRKEK